MIAIEGYLKQVGDIYVEANNEEKVTIVNDFIWYCIRLNGWCRDSWSFSKHLVVFLALSKPLAPQDHSMVLGNGSTS